VGTRRLLNDSQTIAWVTTAAASAKHVLSVCTGSLLLAKAGLLSGKSATSHWGALDLLASLDPTIDVVPDQRVVDSGIITSAGVSAGIDMALYVVEKLCGNRVAIDTARYMDYVSPRA
jgi:transcriptional regulator GlxA family with amidase domain